MLKYFELGLIPLLQSVNNMHRVSATHAAMLLVATGVNNMHCVLYDH